MEFLKYKILGQEQWDDYLGLLIGCTFNYTSEKIKFDVEYSRNIIANEAFLVSENKIIIGAAAIYIEKDFGNHNQISWNGTYCPAPFIDNRLEYKEQERVCKKIMEYVHIISLTYECKNIWLKLDPLFNADQKKIFYNYNYLMKYNYVDQSSLTQIIDLRKQGQELYASISKGHKRHIQHGGIYEMEIYDAYNIQDHLIEAYKEIYEADAGMQTRNSELYKYYLEFIRKDTAAMMLAKKNGKYVAVLMVVLYKNTAYYSSYAELTEQLEGISVGHAMQWKMMNYLKQRKIEFYEMGEQVFGNTHYSSPSKKLIQISNFKRRFGGYTVPFWRGKRTVEIEGGSNV